MRICVIDFGDFPSMHIKCNQKSSDASIPSRGFHLSSFAVCFRQNHKVLVFLPEQKKIIVLNAKDALSIFSSTKTIPKILFDEGVFTKQKKNFLSLVQKQFNKREYFKSIYISLTDRCNLDCKYCYSSHGNHVLPFSVAKAAIDYLKAGNFPLNNLIFMSGGEHTLEFDTLKKIVLYAKKEFPLLRVSLITNGVFNERYIPFLSKHIDNLSISCDGPAQIQDAMRPMLNGKPSSKIVERTIKHLVSSNIPFTINGVLTPASVGNESQILNYFFKLGAKNLSFTTYQKMGKRKFY